MYDLDAYRAAKLLLDSKGEAEAEAEAHALERIVDMTVQGDIAGQTAWIRIAAAIDILRSRAPASKDHVH